MNEKTIKSFIICVILLVLIVVRCFINIDTTIISVVNFIGFSVALVSLLFDIKRFLKKRQFATWIMITITLLSVLVATIVLIILEILCIDEKGDDLITLGALWVTLSTPFVVAVFNKTKVIEKNKTSNE